MSRILHVRGMEAQKDGLAVLVHGVGRVVLHGAVRRGRVARIIVRAGRMLKVAKVGALQVAFAHVQAGAALDVGERQFVATAKETGGMGEGPGGLGGGGGGGVWAGAGLVAIGVVLGDLVEAVHVQLAHEGSDVAVLEVALQALRELLVGMQGEGVVGGGEGGREVVDGGSELGPPDHVLEGVVA